MRFLNPKPWRFDPLEVLLLATMVVLILVLVCVRCAEVHYG